jgi:hypothetical protein
MYYASDVWQFVPPGDVRDQLVAAGAMTIDAKQATGAYAKTTQPITKLSGPNQTWLRPGTLAIYGFDPGLRVPVGLYKGNSAPPTTMNLLQQLDVVTMPSSGLAVYAVPKDVIKAYSGRRTYCVAVPLKDIVYNCDF